MAKIPSSFQQSNRCLSFSVAFTLGRILPQWLLVPWPQDQGDLQPDVAGTFLRHSFVLKPVALGSRNTLLCYVELQGLHQVHWSRCHGRNLPCGAVPRLLDYLYARKELEVTGLSPHAFPLGFIR
jgi:hypothetical protein